MGPSYLQHVSFDDERSLGMLLLKNKHRDLSVRLSAKTLAKGVLVGRYERCAISTPALPLSDKISRVHLYILLDETGLWVVDTASSNGTTHNGIFITSHRVQHDDELILADEVLLRWKYVTRYKK